MITIEILFPEVCNLYGDLYNIKYLEKCIEDVKIINTSLTDTPKFLEEKIDMVYMAPMTESSQEIVINKLKPYKEQINKAINNSVIFLITGNAPEIFGEYIENEDGSKIEAIGITKTFAKRDMMNRKEDLILAKFNDNIDIIGFKNQFTQCYGENQENYLFKIEKGYGLNRKSNLEGIRINNFISTYILGPILIFNPEFTKYILELLGINNPKLKFEEDIVNARNIRLDRIKSLKGEE